MKILLDECVTKKLKSYLAHHEIYTVTNMKWNGLKNGKLLNEAVKEEFDLLLTIDKNIAYQQNVAEYNLIICVLDSKSSKIEDIIKLLDIFNNQLEGFAKRNYYLISG